MSQKEDEYWASQILVARRTQLETVRKAATAWSAVFSGLLGLFGTVTFVGGLNGLDDLNQGTQVGVQVGIVVAAFCTVVATIFAALAANAFPIVTNDLTVDTFQSKNKERAEKALGRLRTSMFLGATAAIIVIGGSTVVLLADKSEPADKAPTIIAVVEGKAHCGRLTSDGEDLAVGGRRLESVSSLTVVSSCP